MTRDEWIRMWECVKIIEYELGLPMYNDRKMAIRKELDRIKKQIQNEIGQME